MHARRACSTQWQQMLPTQHNACAGCQQQSANNNSAEVHHLMQSQQPLDTHIGHGVESHEGLCSKADLYIGNLVCLSNKRMTTDLDTYLDTMQAPFGPFAYISDAAIYLQQLKRKPHKAAKAAQLHGYLAAFSAAHGLDVKLFDQWMELVWAKDRRRFAAQPVELCAEHLSYLKGLIAAPNSPIQHYAAAVDALVKVAERLGLD